MTFTLFVLLAGVSVQAAPAVQNPATASIAEAYYLFLDGRGLESRGEIDAAITAYRRAMVLAPQAAEIRAELAALYARAGRASEAVTEAEAALAIDADNREAHRILGFVQSALSERAAPQNGTNPMVAQAIGHLEKALSGGMRDPGMEVTLGRLYLRNRQFPEAVKTLREFLLMQPGYVDGMMMLADAHAALGQDAEAIAVLEDVVRAAPDEPRGRVRLAEAYEAAGRWPDAASAWAALATAAPTIGFYRTRQATAQMNAGALDEARKTLVTLTTDAPREAMGWYLLSQVERQLGNPAAAEAAARRILAMDTEDPRGLLALAQALAARRDFQGVIQTLEARVASPRTGDFENGLNARLAGELSAALRETGDAAKAIDVLEAARRRTPDDEDVMFDLAATYEQTGQIDKAEAGFRDLIARDPKNAAALNYLGYMLADRGRNLDEAIGFVRRAVLIEPDNPSYLDSLGWAFFKGGRASEARAPLEKAAAARPTSSVVQTHMGDVYFELKDYRAALSAFDRALGGDRRGIDVADVTRKRNRARELAGR